MNPQDFREIVPIGTPTDFGEVAAIKFIGGERYYFCIDHKKVVSFLPADIIEEPKPEKDKS